MAGVAWVELSCVLPLVGKVLGHFPIILFRRLRSRGQLLWIKEKEQFVWTGGMYINKFQKGGVVLYFSVLLLMQWYTGLLHIGGKRDKSINNFEYEIWIWNNFGWNIEYPILHEQVFKHYWKYVYELNAYAVYQLPSFLQVIITEMNC
jgi:hypothetical protein